MSSPSVNAQSGPLTECYKNKKTEEQKTGETKAIRTTANQKTKETKAKTTPAKQERNAT